MIKIKISLELKHNISNDISLSTVKSNINKIFIKSNFPEILTIKFLNCKIKYLLIIYD